MALPDGIELNGATPLDPETFALLNNWAGGGFDTGYAFADQGSVLNFDLGSVALDRIAIVPEPGSLGLLGLGALGMTRLRRKRA